MGSGEALLFKLMVYMPKVLFATVGGIVALIFSGDIKPDGSVKIGWSLIIKLSISIAIGLSIGETVIHYYGWYTYPVMAIGIVFLLASAFGMLLLGIVYQSLKLTFTDKTLPEIVKEVKDAFFAVFGK